VLGSTGSVGVSTLNLFEQAHVEVDVCTLTAGTNVELLASQALKWRPEIAVIGDEIGLPELRSRLAGTGIACAAGPEAIREAASREVQWVMSAIVGFAGLAPTLAAVRTGAIIGLANKESLVCAGPALLRAAKLAGGAIIPVDSEHSAIFQVFDPTNAQNVARLILTASGGPFRTWTREQMAHATPQQALAHPKWDMGPKISIDSATMMNKGLEMIEAAYLFAMPADRVDVLIHPQSIVHSLVEYVDGSTLAQLGEPDMRTPIAVALAWPERMAWPAPKLDLTREPLSFSLPDHARFPALALAKSALELGGAAPGALNAANEVAVAAFLDARLGFLDIAAIVADTLHQVEARGLVRDSMDDVLELAREADSAARRIAREVADRISFVRT
jgi:1-deoxy-D-xylulose-5-phosphate reductoisomerase